MRASGRFASSRERRIQFSAAPQHAEDNLLGQRGVPLIQIR